MQGTSCATRHRDGTVNSLSRQRQRALHMLFLAGGNGHAARLAAYWARLLSDGGVEVDSTAADADGPAAGWSCAAAGLVVVIHTPGHPVPVVAYNCGGRVDFHLGADVNDAAELNFQLCRHVARLLGDLGIGRAHTDAGMPGACPPAVFDEHDRTDRRARPRAA